jgi:hypothetical protein
MHSARATSGVAGNFDHEPIPVDRSSVQQHLNKTPPNQITVSDNPRLTFGLGCPTKLCRVPFARRKLR